MARAVCADSMRTPYGLRMDLWSPHGVRKDRWGTVKYRIVVIHMFIKMVPPRAFQKVWTLAPQNDHSRDLLNVQRLSLHQA
jgi:hypothetical protein